MTGQGCQVACTIGWRCIQPLHDGKAELFLSRYDFMLFLQQKLLKAWLRSRVAHSNVLVKTQLQSAPIVSGVESRDAL